MATVSVFGLDASGKTSLLMRLSGDMSEPVKAPWSFSTKQIKFKPWLTRRVLGCCHITYRTSYWLRFYDIGGDAKIRGIWGNYYADAHCFIYVVNMNDTSRLEESASLFKSVLNDPRMSNKPCLVLLNHSQDSIDISNVEQLLGIQDIVKLKTIEPWIKIAAVNLGVLNGRCTDMDKIQSAMHWLIQTIESQVHLRDRVKRDTLQQQEQWELEKKQRLESLQSKKVHPA